MVMNAILNRKSVRKYSDRQIEDSVLELVKSKGAYKMKSKNITAKGMDMILEVKTKNDKELIDQLSELKGITSVSLLAHDGEVKS